MIVRRLLDKCFQLANMGSEKLSNSLLSNSSLLLWKANMDRTLVVGFAAKTEIKKEQEIDEDAVLRVLIKRRPSGAKDISYLFDKACAADFVIKDSMTSRPLVAIDQLSLRSLIPKSFIVDYTDDQFYLRESSVY